MNGNDPRRPVVGFAGPVNRPGIEDSLPVAFMKCARRILPAETFNQIVAAAEVHMEAA